MEIADSPTRPQPLFARIIDWFEKEHGYNPDPSTTPDGDVLRWAMQRRAYALSVRRPETVPLLFSPSELMALQDLVLEHITRCTGIRTQVYVDVLRNVETTPAQLLARLTAQAGGFIEPEGDDGEGQEVAEGGHGGAQRPQSDQSDAGGHRQTGGRGGGVDPTPPATGS